MVNDEVYSFLTMLKFLCCMRFAFRGKKGTKEALAEMKGKVFEKTECLFSILLHQQIPLTLSITKRFCAKRKKIELLHSVTVLHIILVKLAAAQ